MPKSDRVTRLRQKSLEAIPTLSPERALLLTEFYQQGDGLMSIPLRRAHSFAYLMEHKTIYIDQGELIVGEKGQSPKAAPTYPELCCHTHQDLDILDSRPKIPFKVSPETRQSYTEKIIPYWQGKSIRDLIFQEMTPQWQEAYQAGIFTEFMEQRSPGHTVLDQKIYQLGLLDFIQRIQDSLHRLDYLNDPQAYAKQEELKAMQVCAQAMIHFA